MHPHYNDNCIKRILLVIKSIGRSASKCLMHLSARSKEIEPARRFLIRETFSPRNCIRAQPLQDIVGVHFYKCFYNHKQRFPKEIRWTSLWGTNQIMASFYQNTSHFFLHWRRSSLPRDFHNVTSFRNQLSKENLVNVVTARFYPFFLLGAKVFKQINRNNNLIGRNDLSCLPVGESWW